MIAKNNFNKQGKTLLLILTFLFAGMLTLPAKAQQFNFGADVLNRYVWRGTDFGNSPSIQPALTFTSSGFEVGTWGAYPLSQQAVDVEEHDLYLTYTIDTGNESSLTIGITDYYFPNGGAKFFNFDGDGLGAHWIEPSVSYTGPSSFPVSLYGGFFAHNDPDNSIYLEAGYPVYSGDTEVSLSVGGTPQASGFYFTDKAGILSVALTAGRTVQITETFGLPLVAGYVLNPYHEKSFLVFGFSL